MASHGHHNIELYGTDGTIYVPDPNSIYQGVGKVGYALCGYLTEAGAKVTIGDARYGEAGSSRLARETVIRTC